MRLIALLLNVLWFILGGWAVALSWFFGGLILAITIIGLPYVPGIWRIAIFAAFPFGYEMISVPKGVAGSAFSGILNLIWLILAGIWIALGHILTGLLLCLTIIGIPFGVAHFKLAGAAFMPVGKDIVTKNARSVVRLVEVRR